MHESPLSPDHWEVVQSHHNLRGKNTDCWKKKNNLVQSGVTVTSSVPGIPQILSVINVNGVFLQSTLNLAESYNPEQIVEKIFKLKFQCKTYISKEKNSKDAPPSPP